MASVINFAILFFSFYLQALVAKAHIAVKEKLSDKSHKNGISVPGKQGKKVIIVILIFFIPNTTIRSKLQAEQSILHRIQKRQLK